MPSHTRGPRRARRLTAALFALALGAGAAPAAHAHATAEEPVPDTWACPAVEELPEGADPGEWRCEVMTAVGRLDLGRAGLAIDEPMTLTFAEGRLDGEFAQVFGELDAAPLRVPGTPLTLTPRYGGFSDFESDEERRGELSLTFALAGPLVPPGCSIGTDARPVHLVLKETTGPAVVSEDPLVVTFGVEDNAFAVPRTSGCGRLGPLLDAVLGLPSPAGENGIALDAEVTLLPYGS
ncbi:hypothetical protein [Streptomyces litchfieldiae]|uniref:Secreted protein n=1 Tax=Streptomyces litchfieldiae TaxID=3075543 RepID=A0ABU2MRD0_9ACTN|nr:hypothetical protein [Streptomyces sp. DSM 44938]MDT0343149.1 hypothetical protein [Streptomyces sp. DSM 44938]